MRKIVVPENGEILVGSLREQVHGMADADVIGVQGGRYIDPPVVEDGPANADAEPPAEDAPKAKRGRR